MCMSIARMDEWKLKALACQTKRILNKMLLSEKLGSFDIICGRSSCSPSGKAGKFIFSLAWNIKRCLAEEVLSEPFVSQRSIQYVNSVFLGAADPVSHAQTSFMF